MSRYAWVWGEFLPPVPPFDDFENVGRPVPGRGGLPCMLCRLPEDDDRPYFPAADHDVLRLSLYTYPAAVLVEDWFEDLAWAHAGRTLVTLV